MTHRYDPPSHHQHQHTPHTQQVDDVVALEVNLRVLVVGILGVWCVLVLVDHACVEPARPGTRLFTCHSVLLFFLDLELEIVVVV